MEAWIDTYHAVEGLARLGTYSFLTDGAVGAQEEDNLRHLIAKTPSFTARARVLRNLLEASSNEIRLDRMPQLIEDVDALIAKYRDVGVGASELLIAVQKKYARDQPQRRANQFSV